MDWAKTTARVYKKHLSFGIWCDFYWRFYRWVGAGAKNLNFGRGYPEKKIRKKGAGSREGKIGWGMWGRAGGSGPPTPGDQPPYPRPIFPPTPAPFFSYFFFWVPPPKIQIFCPRPPAHLTPTPAHFSSKDPYPRPTNPRAPVPPVLPHFTSTWCDNKKMNVLNVNKRLFKMC